MTGKIIDFIIQEVANEPLTDLKADEDLLGSGIVDSIGMVKLIGFFEREYQVAVPPEEMTVENFMTVNDMVALIASQSSRSTSSI